MITWTRCYEPWRMARDEGLKEKLKESLNDVEEAVSALIKQDWTVVKVLNS